MKQLNKVRGVSQRKSASNKKWRALNNRRISALDRLRVQLKDNFKPISNKKRGDYDESQIFTIHHIECVRLTAEDKTRIKKEISVLEGKIVLPS